LFVLLATVATLLLIAAVNLSNLLVGRTMARQSELGVRSALGAGSGRLVRQLVVENFLLASIGGALGIGLAFLLLRVVRMLAADLVPRLYEVEPDVRVIAFAFALTVALPLLLSLVPALRGARVPLAQTMNAVTTRSTANRTSLRWRYGMIALQIGLCAVLAIGGGLLLRSLWKLTNTDPGFRTNNLLVVELVIPTWKYEGFDFLQAHRRIRDRLGQLPGVISVGSDKIAPFQGFMEGGRFRPPGWNESSGDPEPRATFHPVTPGFFDAMGMTVLEGRDVRDSDVRGEELVGVVNQELVRRYYPEGDLVGRQLLIGRNQLRVVGLVSDARHHRLEEPPEPEIYLSVGQFARAPAAFMLHTEGEPLALAETVRAAIWEVEPDQAIHRIATMEQLVQNASATQRLLAWLVAGFAAAGLLLASMGIFGVLSNMVRQRSGEMGIRVALGARPSSLAALVLRSGLVISMPGWLAEWSLHWRYPASSSACCLKSKRPPQRLFWPPQRGCWE
jgi:predicted permease